MYRTILFLLSLAGAPPALAQTRATTISDGQYDLQPAQQQQTPLRTDQVGRVGVTSSGEVGQRLTRASVAAEAGIQPMVRISNRIQSRVQSRIRNRIDRNYDPQANASDPFAAAEDQARTAGRPNH